MANFYKPARQGGKQRKSRKKGTHGVKKPVQSSGQSNGTSLENANETSLQSRLLQVHGLDSQGRGVARWQGKTQFVAGALPEEEVEAKLIESRKRYDELVAVNIVQASDHRKEPFCPHYHRCGGCSLQHMSLISQVEYKQAHLKGLLAKQGINPKSWADSLTHPDSSQNNIRYRRRVKLGVRYRKANDEVIVGFREEGSAHLTSIDACPVVVTELEALIQPLTAVINQLKAKDRITQIDMLAGSDAVAVAIRYLGALSAEDKAILVEFSDANNLALAIWTRPKSKPSTSKQNSSSNDVSTSLPSIEWLSQQDSVNIQVDKVNFSATPFDFVQVNSVINQSMLVQAMQWLNLPSSSFILDLYSGLGNFALPLAKRGHQVHGVEGVKAMTERASLNATQNGITTLTAQTANLDDPDSLLGLFGKRYDCVILDPPRAGAAQASAFVAAAKVPKVLYVSCDPATLARDAEILVRGGYDLVKVGVMDMFSHTAHVESMALFEYSSRPNQK